MPARRRRIRPKALLGHRQFTDVYLLALATAHDARLVTLDKSVPLSTVRGADVDSLFVI